MTSETIRADALAGILLAILALPQGIAFATLAGMPPQYGIYASIVPCAIAAIFGSSHHVVSGPTNANSLALFAALSPLAVPGGPTYITFALTVTLLVGMIQFGIGIFRLAWITDFIAPAVLIGFLSGGAVLIGLYALPDFFGLHLESSHKPFAIASGLVSAVRNTDLNAFAVGFSTLLMTAGLARISRRLPFMLIGILAGYGLSELLDGFPQWGSIDRIGALPSVLPPVSFPITPFSKLPELIPIAGALSIVALGQSVSIAKALAQKSGQYLDIEREITGQGLSNIFGSFFSSYVSCGSLNRSLPNFLAGGRTPLAAFLSSGFLIVFAFISRPLLERLPMPAIAAMLIYIACGLFDARGFVRLFHVNRPDFYVAVITGGGLLALTLPQAILIGCAASLLLYLHRTAHPGITALVPNPALASRTFTPIDDFESPMAECPQIKLLRIEGAIYFGASGYVSQRLHNMRQDTTQKHLLVMVKSMNFIDLAGAEVWEHELTARRALGGDLYFHRPRKAVHQLWKKIGFDQRLGEDNVFASKREAVAFIYARLDQGICATCVARIFTECRDMSAVSHQAAEAANL